MLRVCCVTASPFPLQPATHSSWGPCKRFALLHRRRGANLGFTKAGSVAASSVFKGLPADQKMRGVLEKYSDFGNVRR